ncbi:AGAP001776-PA [Anopheles gambiae str. PEST]|uniref:AGAP001776-PA n=1 Tax=Anopheles gambiae TaxID=7165 RepID=A0NHD5_ANOGA|nr:AGAP001776-PA [Anopheles gambiae str. PEST]
MLPMLRARETTEGALVRNDSFSHALHRILLIGDCKKLAIGFAGKTLFRLNTTLFFLLAHMNTYQRL